MENKQNEKRIKLKGIKKKIRKKMSLKSLGFMRPFFNFGNRKIFSKNVSN